MFHQMETAGQPPDEDEQYHDMIIARDDGRIEIYAYQLNNPFPVLCFQD